MSCERETYESRHDIPWDVRIFPSVAGMAPGGIVARIPGRVCAGFGHRLFFCCRPCPPHRRCTQLTAHFHGHGLLPFFKPCLKHQQTLPIMGLFCSRPCLPNWTHFLGHYPFSSLSNNKIGIGLSVKKISRTGLLKQ